jgi:hypothetical protein
MFAGRSQALKSIGLRISEILPIPVSMARINTDWEVLKVWCPQLILIRTRFGARKVYEDGISV